MKKKLYYIIYILSQFCLGIYGYLNSNMLAKEQLEVLELGDISFETVLLSCKISMLISVLISIVLFYLILKNNKLERNKFVIFLVISSIFVSFGIVAFLATIALFLIFKEPPKDRRKKHYMKKLPNVCDLKSTRMDYITGIILVCDITRSASHRGE